MNTTAESSNSNSRVLIVDDNSQFTHRVSELLQNTHHYVVCEENDPRRALETARSFHPDLILLDLVMPQADGTEVAAQITADWTLHSVPIVFVTALITREEARDGRHIEGHRVVPKPNNNSELIKVVEETLPRRCDSRNEGAMKEKLPAIQAIKPGYVRLADSLGTARTRGTMSASNTTTTDARSIRNILIHDNDPASLRLLREVYLGPAGSTLSQYFLLIVALLILAVAVGVVWI